MLVADLDNLGFAIDNIEGITFGKTLENGRRSLVLVADNNFTAGLPSQFLTFEVAGVPEPATWAMLIIGFGLVGSAMRRRPVVAAAV
ncbi:PEPxxWA-CTERM sorting domain-containing protein [Sphingosinicellaceae bacterium]|nr:PEPxxWA-CTERM sorting domain-containing protein [Sphingosinicellaceae bacterium]